MFVSGLESFFTGLRNKNFDIGTVRGPKQIGTVILIMYFPYKSHRGRFESIYFLVYATKVVNIVLKLTIFVSRCFVPDWADAMSKLLISFSFTHQNLEVLVIEVLNIRVKDGLKHCF